MKNLSEIVSNCNTSVELPFLDGTLTVSADRHVYVEIRKKYEALADDAYNRFLLAESKYRKLDDLVAYADDDFKELLLETLKEVVNDAVSLGMLTLDADTIYDEYCKAGYIDQFLAAFAAFYKPYFDTLAKLEHNKAERRENDDEQAWFNRTYGTGDAFNISGRLASGATNLLEKGIANSDFKELLNDVSKREDLRDGVRVGIENYYRYIIEYFPKKINIKFGDFPTNDSCNTANSALKNLKNAVLTDEQKKELVKIILEKNPFLDEAYAVFADKYPENIKQFVAIGDFFGTKAIFKKVNNDLIAYVNENMGFTEADLDNCRLLLEQKLSEVGISKEQAAPVYAVIQTRADQLDLAYRTVESVVFDTRDEADDAKAAVAANAGTLKKGCLDLITRTDYVDYIASIMALPIPRAIATIYATQYEQKLAEFDKKCKLAARYEEERSGEKRSFMSRLASLTTSSDAKKSAWDEVTHNGKYKLSDIMAGAPAEAGVTDKINGLFGKN